MNRMRSSHVTLLEAAAAFTLRRLCFHKPLSTPTFEPQRSRVHTSFNGAFTHHAEMFYANAIG